MTATIQYSPIGNEVVSLTITWRNNAERQQALQAAQRRFPQIASLASQITGNPTVITNEEGQVGMILELADEFAAADSNSIRQAAWQHIFGSAP